MNGSLQRLLHRPSNVRLAVALYYWGRSGSFLLHSFFDDHPEVLTVPPYALYGAPTKIRERLAEGAGDRPALSRWIVETFSRLFEIDSHNRKLVSLQGAAGVVYPGVDRNAFAQHLETCLQSTASEAISVGLVLGAIHVAYAAALGRTNLATDSPVIVLQAHDPGVASRVELAATFPEIRFLTCVRYPEKTLDSHFHHMYREVEGMRDVAHLPRFLLTQLLSNDKLEEVDVDRHRAVRFEDMHGATRTLTERLARWLDLSWHPRLLDSTVDGVPMLFRTKGLSVTHAGPRSLSRKDLRLRWLNRHDRWRLRFVLEGNYREWGYAPETPPADGWLPSSSTLQRARRTPWRMQRVMMDDQRLAALRSAHWKGSDVGARIQDIVEAHLREHAWTLDAFEEEVAARRNGVRLIPIINCAST